MTLRKSRSFAALRMTTGGDGGSGAACEQRVLRFAQDDKSVKWALPQRVLSALNYLLRDLLAQGDGVEGFVFCQAAEDCQLGA